MAKETKAEAKEVQKSHEIVRTSKYYEEARIKLPNMPVKEAAMILCMNEYGSRVKQLYFEQSANEWKAIIL